MFSSFFLNGFVLQKSNPSLFYLCHVFKKTKEEIKDAMSVHHLVRDYPFAVIHNNINYLLDQGFTHDDIFNDLIIILYSM